MNSTAAAHQHLNLLSSHLNQQQADYLASAAMALSPKYNSAFTVTNLLNPVLEESYKKQNDLTSNFQQVLSQSYQTNRNTNSSNNNNPANNTANSASNNSTSSSTNSSSSTTPTNASSSSNSSASNSSSSSSSSTPSSSSSSSSSSVSSLSSINNLKNNTSPLSSLNQPTHPSSLMNGNYPASFCPLPSSAGSVNGTAYFNYPHAHQSANQFNSSISQSMSNTPHSHHAYGGLQSAYHHSHTPYHYNTGVPSGIDNENLSSYSQIQYPNAPSWYSNPTDPRFASN